MNLEEHYNTLYTQSLAKIASNTYEIDPMIDDETDQRFGITLVIRPNERTKANIQSFLNEIQTIEPNQYYYPDSDLHVTLLSVISCYTGFDINDIDINRYVDLIRETLKSYTKFNIQFRGITASPSCIMIRGFATEALNAIREDLRAAFKSTTLQQSIDKRYTIQAAHATVVRFKEKLSNPTALIDLIEKYKDFDFGTFEVNRIELVHNDWYQRKRFVQKLESFDLR